MNRQDRYDSLFRYYAFIVGLDWRLLKAQAIAESNLNPAAVSPCGAKGLAQFMDATWGEWGRGSNVWNPEAAIRAQGRYLKYLVVRFKNIGLALAAYNWGMGNIEKIKDKINTAEEIQESPLLPVETRSYLARIHRLWQDSSGEDSPWSL